MREELEIIVKKNQVEVKEHFKMIVLSMDFGGYIKPENYFLSYDFETIKELNEAKESGLIEEIKKYHRECLRKNGYPIEGIKDCCFASQEECDRDYNGNWYFFYK